ncbi:arabinose efflux permease family protein [Actinoalloteichus hymeniacidonis]|uniref:Arabinose efflux permease family protein n=2 Tax=Actinoalloteichus hymeniacidonis TaxID=340345 RepID=A0AAC9MWW3_9PSEU|nr:arabinose efflux permease family protein [Actinoalloteichus hymeniacidonis]
MLVAGFAVFALLYAVQPVLPQFADQYGLGPGGASLAISAGTGGLAIGLIPLAVLSQAIGRRPVMIASVVAAVLIGAVVPLAGSFPMLITLRALQGLAVAGLASVAMAYLAEETRSAGLGAAIGLYVAGNSLGGMSGRLLTGVLADLTNWRIGLWAVTALAAACAVVFVLALPASSGPRPAPLRFAEVVGGLRAALTDPVLYGPYIVAALGTGGFVSLYNVLGFRLLEPPFLLAPAVVALVFLAYAIGSVSSATAGRAADRLGRPGVLIGGLGITLVGVLLTVPDHLAPILIGLGLLTGGFFAAHAVASGWVGSRASGRARTQAPALYLLAYYLGSSVGGAVGGVAYGRFGWTGLVVVVVGWLLLAAVAAMLAAVAQRRSTDRAQAPSLRPSAAR